MKENKTALMNYKEWLKSFYESFPMIGDAAYNSMQSKATELLEKEKKIICDAWQEGYYAENENEENNCYKYFEKAFNQ